MIKIVNWLLTRRCNARCSFCRIVKNYHEQPEEYNDISYYNKHEMSTDYIKNLLLRFQKHNPQIFHIFYGGEPTLREDIVDILKFCNDNSILYTLISNMIDTEKLSKILQQVKIRGLTGSIDPVIVEEGSCKSSSRYMKSMKAFRFLSDITRKHLVDDVVAEVTIDKTSLEKVPLLIKQLSRNSITSSITFVDIAKTKYYDFSDVTNSDVLVRKDEAIDLISKLGAYKIHIPEMLSKIVDVLPSQLDCKLEKDIHNLTIDTDGTVRLCLRIRGTMGLRCDQIISEKGNINKLLQEKIRHQKKNLCCGCNWTCMIMSKNYDEKEILNHKKGV